MDLNVLLKTKKLNGLHSVLLIAVSNFEHHRVSYSSLLFQSLLFPSSPGVLSSHSAPLDLHTHLHTCSQLPSQYITLSPSGHCQIVSSPASVNGGMASATGNSDATTVTAEASYIDRVL